MKGSHPESSVLLFISYEGDCGEEGRTEYLSHVHLLPHVTMAFDNLLKSQLFVHMTHAAQHVGGNHDDL